jgi:hypothetical protein
MMGGTDGHYLAVDVLTAVIIFKERGQVDLFTRVAY